MVLESMKDAAFKAERRANNETVLTHENGPWLMPQFNSLCDDGLDAKIESICYESERVKGTLLLSNAKSPAFPVKITALNDWAVQYLSDDSFFMNEGECRRIEFTLRNDDNLSEKIRFSVKAWNKKENIIES